MLHFYIFNASNKPQHLTPTRISSIVSKYTLALNKKFIFSKPATKNLMKNSHSKLNTHIKV